MALEVDELGPMETTDIVLTELTMEGAEEHSMSKMTGGKKQEVGTKVIQHNQLYCNHSSTLTHSHLQDKTEDSAITGDVHQEVNGDRGIIIGTEEGVHDKGIAETKISTGEITGQGHRVHSTGIGITMHAMQRKVQEQQQREDWTL